MGNKHLTETKHPRRRTGKALTPLHEKLKNVEWGEFRIGDLFEKLNLRFLKSEFDKDQDISRYKTDEFNLPLVNAKDGDNGIMYYGRSKDFESEKLTIDIVNDGAISTGNVYSQPQNTGVLYNAYLIKPNFKTSESCLHFFTTSIFKSIKHKFGYENKAGWEKVKQEKIQLPTRNDKIDFDFMENFVAEIENERIKKLENYLIENNLMNYELTEKEKEALAGFESLNFEDFNVIDVFKVKNTGNILSREITPNSGNIPYLCASSENNGVSSSISYDEKFIDKGNCVFIGGKTFVVSYQEKDFFSNDSHNLVLYLKDDEKRTKSIQLFLASCVNKSLGYKYSWGDSISNKKIQKDKVNLPTKNGVPDYELMETLISAVQKMVIKSVVQYVEGKIGVTRKVVTKT
ncbi:restriction endonuclease subunit S [Flavobacterium sp.]|uniref:restriction endonuclease subunit S n=1 Tax=Flavobacterium sp. TaxID=239 RepID=UPI0040484179